MNNANTRQGYSLSHIKYERKETIGNCKMDIGNTKRRRRSASSDVLGIMTKPCMLREEMHLDTKSKHKKEKNQFHCHSDCRLKKSIELCEEKE